MRNMALSLGEIQLFQQWNKILVVYLLYMADLSFPLTRTMVKAFAWALAKRSGNGDRLNAETGPGEHWWTNFKSLHPKIILRSCDMLERTCAEALNHVTVNKYFTLFSKTLDNNGLKNKPRQLFNFDEIFLPINSIYEKAVTHRVIKVSVINHMEQVNILCCFASAAGIPHPPMIIYAKSFPSGQYRFEGPDDAVYTRNELDWIDSELLWFG